MKSINKKKIHVSKATKSEKLLARLLLPFLLFVVFLMEISLGSRSHSETKGFFEKARSTATEKIRGWEKPAAEGTWRSKTDGRSNAGFHFNWPKSAEPPEFDSLPNSEDRADKLKKAIILGKSKIRVEFDTSDDKLNWLEEPLNSAGEVLLRKKVIMMLPGDRLKLKNFQQTSIPKVWSIRVRAVAVTQDRLDAPLPVRVGFLAETSFRSEIDPLGQHFDIIIPPPAEIQRNKPNDFVIEWPATNSGILVIDGIKPIESNSAVGKKNHKNLIVHIDNLGTQIAALKKTIKTIKGLSSERQGTILIRNAIPSTTDTGISKEALLVNRNPIELGATISNPNLKELITRDYFLVKRAIQQGGSARKIVLNSGLTCESNCTDANISLNSQSAFTSTLTISRIEEFESTKRFIRNDEFITDPGLLYVEINNPSDTLRLNSETKINSQSSSITWLFSGLLRPFGYTNSKLQFEEKLAQLDNWLAKLMESFLVTSHSANIAVILHDNSQALSLGKNQMRRSVTRGEILLHLNELSDSRNQREDVLTFDEPVSSLSVMRMFSKRAFSSQLISAVEEFIPELKSDAVAVNQLQRTQLITITPSGWLIDPIENGDSKIRNYMAIASPEKIHEIQEVSNRMRQRSRLISINFAFPGSNQSDESIETFMTTSLEPLGCESHSENISTKWIPVSQNSSNRQIVLKGSREPSTLWHVRCLLDGKITTQSHVKLRFTINGQAVTRESFSLGEYLHPVRGFLWHSPDSLELTGAQILDATSALSVPTLSGSAHSKVNIWTDRFPTSTHLSQPTYVFKNGSGVVSPETTENQDNQNKFSERK